MEVVNALGRRKSAIARIYVSEGTGKITINKRDLAQYFPSSILQYVVKQPLEKLGVAEKYDIKVNLCGGVSPVSHKPSVWPLPVHWLRLTPKTRRLCVLKVS